MKRRDVLKRSALLAALVNTGLGRGVFAGGEATALRIGACDWSIGKSADPAAFELAGKIGLEGIQVNLGSEANDLHLRKTEVQQDYISASRRHNVKIASLAIGELNNVPYKSEEKTEQWVWDSIDVAQAFGVKTVLLAFFVKNDLRNDAIGKNEVIRRLKMVAPKAERSGVTLGLETYLSAEEHMDIIQAVGSKSVKVFYDFRNSADAGYDVIREFKWLGPDNICELHMKENGMLLSKGTLDWHRICDTIRETGYIGDGWMQIEWSMPDKGDVVVSYKDNLEFLKRLFQS